MPGIDRLTATVQVGTPVVRSARVLQLEGMFDVPPGCQSQKEWQLDVTLPEAWNVGLIVGPSGCGKSTLARHFWPEQIARTFDWPASQSILDGFPAGMSIKDITGILCSVGFSSPPSWMRPFATLSNGEQFRVNMARVLAEQPELAVVDEFTSVVDRDVAKIASAAVAKAVRKRQQKLVAVTCHFDVAEWLEPDWVLQPHTGEFVAGRLLRRPSIELEIARVHRQAWELFKPYHYLSSEHHKAAACFVGFVWGRPAAFCSVLHFPHPTHSGWKEHRTVCLPDFQGVGLGNRLSDYVASLFAATDKPYRDTTGHPGHIHYRLRSPQWRCTRSAGLAKKKIPGHRRGVGVGRSHATNRLTWSFEYIGPARAAEARKFGIFT